MAQVKGGSVMSGSSVAALRGIAKKGRTLSQKNILAFVSDREIQGYRYASVPARQGRLTLWRLGRCLAYSVSTEKFPPRSWGWSCLEKEWLVLQGCLRNWYSGANQEK